MEADATPIFLLLSAVMGLGFLGYLFFERTRFSDVLVLIAFGVVIGPVLHLIPTGTFSAAAPFITSLALAMIMFEGGLELNANDLVKGAGRGSLLALAGFILGVAGTTVVAHFWLHLDWLYSVLLAAALSHTSSVVVFPILGRLGLSERTRGMLGVESAIAEVLSVVTVLALSEAIALQNSNITHAASQMAAQFSVAIVLGLAIGLIWARLLVPLKSRKYHYMLTLAVLLALFVGVGSLGGSGPIGVLVFGIVLGNADTVRRTGLQVGEFNEQMRTFQGEITFFLRTFFFVYLGISLSLSTLLNPSFIKASAFLVGAFIVVRILAVQLCVIGMPTERGASLKLSVMIPRGLATAVLATIPLAQYRLTSTADFAGYALGVIILSNIVTTAGVFLATRGKQTSLLAPEAVLS